MSAPRTAKCRTCGTAYAPSQLADDVCFFCEPEQGMARSDQQHEECHYCSAAFGRFIQHRPGEFVTQEDAGGEYRRYCPSHWESLRTHDEWQTFAADPDERGASVYMAIEDRRWQYPGQIRILRARDIDAVCDAFGRWCMEAHYTGCDDDWFDRMRDASSHCRSMVETVAMIDARAPHTVKVWVDRVWIEDEHEDREDV